jgi:DNA-binding winged helix-turn-helix (wHTH) protein
MRMRFGTCTLDAERRELRNERGVVPLSPHAFDLLERLAARRPRAISKEDLLGALWPTTFVTESNLAGLVAEIRRALGDDARDPRFVRTVHGFGYALADGGAIAEDEHAAFRLVWGAREVRLSEGENLLGRDADAPVAIDDPTVSRHHARIVVAGGLARLEDLGSKNGTWLRGRRIARPELLEDGDGIRVGPAALTFRAFPDAGSTETFLE